MKAMKLGAVLESYKQSLRGIAGIEFQGLKLKDLDSPRSPAPPCFPGAKVYHGSHSGEILIADAEGRLFTGKRKGPGRHDSGTICDIAPLVAAVALLSLNKDPRAYPYCETDIRVIHLKAAESWEAVFANLQVEINALATLVDPEVIERLREDEVRRVSLHAELRMRREKDAAKVQEDLEACRKWWQEEGLKIPHVRMLIAQPKKGYQWQLKFREFIEAELRKRFGLTSVHTFDFARNVVKSLHPPSDDFR